MGKKKKNQRNRRSRRAPDNVYTYRGVISGTFTGQVNEVGSIANLDTMIQALVSDGQYADIAYAKLTIFGIGTTNPFFAKIYDLRYESGGTFTSLTETASALERDQFDAALNCAFEFDKKGNLDPRVMAYVGNSAVVQYTGTSRTIFTKAARSAARYGESIALDEPKHDIAYIASGTVGSNYSIEFRLEIGYNVKRRRLLQVSH